jgi:hypothetical protein
MQTPPRWRKRILRTLASSHAPWKRRRASRHPGDEIRPVGESAGEVAHWRLWLKLNDLGRGVIALERHLSES